MLIYQDSTFTLQLLKYPIILQKNWFMSIRNQVNTQFNIKNITQTIKENLSQK